MQAQVIVEAAHVQQLLDALRQQGYRVVGPTVRDGAIVYDELSTVDDLPVEWTDAQDGSTYRLRRRADQALFGYVVGPLSWKKSLHPPVLRLWQAQRQGRALQMVDSAEETPRYAFIGVRACELHAMAVQDKAFMHGTYADPTYAAPGGVARRRQLWPGGRYLLLRVYARWSQGHRRL